MSELGLEDSTSTTMFEIHYIFEAIHKFVCCKIVVEPKMSLYKLKNALPKVRKYLDCCQFVVKLKSENLL